MSPVQETGRNLFHEYVCDYSDLTLNFDPIPKNLSHDNQEEEHGAVPTL